MVKFFEENGRFLKGGEAVAVRVVALSSSGLVDDIVRYAPFGEVRGGALPTNITDRGFTGHKHNAEIGLIYMNARFYDPNTNRMLTPDTIVPDPANPQSFNRYSYVNNNPLNYADPTGHDAVAANLTPEEAQVLADAIGLLLLENGDGTTVLEFLQDLVLPSVGGAIAATGIVEGLQAAGFVIGGVSSTTIGVAASVVIGGAYIWNSTGTSNALVTLGYVQQSLLNAIERSDTGNTINFFANNTFLSPDIVSIRIDNVNENGDTFYGGKYNDRIGSYGIDRTGELLVDLVINYAVENRDVNNPITYYKDDTYDIYNEPQKLDHRIRWISSKISHLCGGQFDDKKTNAIQYAVQVSSCPGSG
ncbi:MAG: RHS repeat-associated core domain-containing protein [Ardenticatenaceae bacterium]|nr:RHS repeat-associated core domain-containing protein [Ardenticatenaceae bacterium]